MSKPTAAPSTQPYEPPKSVLPCPTSPLQQTESESWEHTRGYGSDYARYSNDHISDRVSDSASSDSDADDV